MSGRFKYALELHNFFWRCLAAKMLSLYSVRSWSLCDFKCELMFCRCGREVTEMVASYLTALSLDKVVVNHGNARANTNNTNASLFLKTWNVLDIGTGDGLLLQELARIGYVHFSFIL